MINIESLTENDRGRVVNFRSELFDSLEQGVLIDWSETRLYLTYANVAPLAIMSCDPRSCEFTDKKATLAHRYGMQFRPPGLGAVPKGFIPDPKLVRPAGDPDYHNPERRFGWLDYPVKLEEADVKGYELNYFGLVWRLP